MKTCRVKEMIDYINNDGWYLLRQKGSHRQYRHKTKSGTVTVPGKLSDDLLPNTSKSILKKAGLT